MVVHFSNTRKPGDCTFKCANSTTRCDIYEDVSHFPYDIDLTHSEWRPTRVRWRWGFWYRLEYSRHSKDRWNAHPPWNAVIKGHRHSFEVHTNLGLSRLGERYVRPASWQWKSCWFLTTTNRVKLKAGVPNFRIVAPAIYNSFRSSCFSENSPCVCCVDYANDVIFLAT